MQHLSNAINSLKDTVKQKLGTAERHLSGAKVRWRSQVIHAKNGEASADAIAIQVIFYHKCQAIADGGYLYL